MGNMKNARKQEIFNLYPTLIDVGKILLTFLIFSNIAKAQIVSNEDLSHSENENKFSYTIGTRLKSNDFAEHQQTTRIRPVIGLRYGKWQIGIGDGRTWLNEGKFGTEPTLSYQFIENPEINIGLSMRAHNVSTGESFDVFEGGKTTLRTRLMIQRKITNRWRMHFDWTQDILNKGDSTTLTTGLSYSWPVFKESELILNFGGTWATAEHWKNSNLPNIASQNHIFKTGFEKASAGLTFKQAMSQNWAWYSSLGVSSPIADLKRIQGSREVVSGQIGVLYFKR